MLCLHLLQASLVHLNTLLVQNTLARPEWADRLTEHDRRALSPLCPAPRGNQEVPAVATRARLVDPALATVSA